MDSAGHSLASRCTRRAEPSSSRRHLASGCGGVGGFQRAGLPKASWACAWRSRRSSSAWSSSVKVRVGPFSDRSRGAAPPALPSPGRAPRRRSTAACQSLINLPGAPAAPPFGRFGLPTARVRPPGHPGQPSIRSAEPSRSASGLRSSVRSPPRHPQLRRAVPEPAYPAALVTSDRTAAARPAGQRALNVPRHRRAAGSPARSARLQREPARARHPPSRAVLGWTLPQLAPRRSCWAARSASAERDSSPTGPARGARAVTTRPPRGAGASLPIAVAWPSPERRATSTPRPGPR